MNTQPQSQPLIDPNFSVNKLIYKSRLEKQMSFLDKQYSYEIKQRDIIIKNAMSNDLIIHLPSTYPFDEPKFTYQQLSGYLSELIGQWSPKLKILEIIPLLCKKINQMYSDELILKQYPIYSFFRSQKVSLTLILALSIIVRVFVGLGSYSGHNHWPNLGDFEAHRNWMSITLQRPITQWYYENQNQIDGIWWRIDYPPIAAYLSLLLGQVYAKIQPQSMLLQRGFESDGLKAFMRFSSLFVEMALTYVAVVLLAKGRNQVLKKISLFVVLLRPDLILIDHGHFQYNSLIIGLVLLAYYCLINQSYYLCCVLFTIALHSKQMAAYYALAYLAGLIGVTFHRYRFDRRRILIQIIKYGVIVIGLSVVIWWPWITSWEDLRNVIQAIFPIHRGLYQLKVPNFWCITDTIIKWETHFSKDVLMALCTIISVFASLPSILVLIYKPTKKSIPLCFFNISIGFFLFAYHAHEKSILIPFTMLSLVWGSSGLGGQLCFDLMIGGCLGMFHLLVQDGLTIQFFAILILYSVFAMSLIQMQSSLQQTQAHQINPVQQLHQTIYPTTTKRIIFWILLIILFCGYFWIPPPVSLPYLYNLLFATFSFAINIYAWLLGNTIIMYDLWKQLIIKKQQ